MPPHAASPFSSNGTLVTPGDAKLPIGKLESAFDNLLG
jgi:hypothetical protein